VQKAADRGVDLYRDERISVTPSWLSVDNSRYSIRTVVKLEYGSIRPQLGIAYIFFFGAIALMAYSLYQFTKPALPTLVPWIMLLGSEVIFLYAATVAFRSKTRYQITVTLLDGGKVPILTGNTEQAQGLLDSLTLAMDWHRNSDVLIEAERSSHVRQAHASSTKGVVSKDASSKGVSGKGASDEASVVKTPHPAVTDPKQHPSRVVHKLPPFIAAIFKGRN
jgi:hypothetical protein